MNNINKEFADYLYNRLPSMYRTSDREQLLRRFIESFVEGGFSPLLQDTLNIMDLLDVDKCPSKFLPQLCKMYGYEYTLEIPELFQRRLLKHIVEMYKRKGTKSVVRFIARELTGFDSEIIENKDFTEEHIKLSKWDKKFENYRNFILKLTAPYENSNLFNKEEIVIKIVNDFLPTNSQVFLITVYWFKEETEIVKKSIEDCIHEAVKDYQGDYNTLTVSKGDYIENFRSLKMQEEHYIHGFYGEEDSYLNDEVASGIYTNAVLRMRDTVKFATELYERFLSTMEEQETSVLNFSDMETTTFLESFFYTNAERVKLSLEELNLSITTEEELLDKATESTHSEEQTFNKSNEFFRDGTVRDNFNFDVLQSSRTLEADCDIINSLLGEESYDFRENNITDNSKLNFGILITNGIMSYDIIKEQGKPDKIIFL